MVFGLVQYRFGGKYLGTAGLRTAEPGDRTAVRRMAYGDPAFVVAAALLAGLQVAGMLKLTLLGVAQSTGFFMAVLALLYFSSLLFFGKLSLPEKKRIILIFVFFLAAVLFWSGYEQAGSSMNLFAERLTDRMIGHWEMPASWLQAVNPVFIIVFAPFVGVLWVWLRSREPSTPAKMGYGLVLLAVGFLVVAWGATFTRGGAKVSPMWLGRDLLPAHGGRAVLEPCRIEQRDQARAAPAGRPADGDMVHGNRARQSHRRPGRRRVRRPDGGEMFAAVAKVTGVAGLVLLLFSRPLKRLAGGESGHETRGHARGFRGGGERRRANLLNVS